MKSPLKARYVRAAPSGSPMWRRLSRSGSSAWKNSTPLKPRDAAAVIRSIRTSSSRPGATSGSVTTRSSTWL